MMINKKTDIRILQSLFTDTRFESIFNAVDRLHDAASSGKLHEVTNLSADEVLGWLRDIAYTAAETIREIEDGPSDAAVQFPTAGGLEAPLSKDSMVESSEWLYQN